MKWIARLFGRKEPSPAPAPGDVMSISREVTTRIDAIVTELFATYHEAFLHEPITYIVYAVWGAKKDGEVTFTQKEIHAKIDPLIRELHSMIVVDGMIPAQRSAVDFILRGLLINRVTYMVEMTRTQILTKQAAGTPAPPDMKSRSRGTGYVDDGETLWYGNLINGDDINWPRGSGSEDDPE